MLCYSCYNKKWLFYSFFDWLLYVFYYFTTCKEWKFQLSQKYFFNIIKIPFDHCLAYHIHPVIQNARHMGKCLCKWFHSGRYYCVSDILVLLAVVMFHCHSNNPYLVVGISLQRCTSFNCKLFADVNSLTKLCVKILNFTIYFSRSTK